MDTLSDVIINLETTPRVRAEACCGARRWKRRESIFPAKAGVFFDVRHEFPDAWQMLRNTCLARCRDPRLGLRMGAEDVPVPAGLR